MDRKIGCRDDDVFILLQYADIGDKPPGSRRRIFGVGIRAFKAFHPAPNTIDIVRNGEQGRIGIPIRHIIGRHKIPRILRQQIHPAVEIPVVQERGFEIEEVLDLGAGNVR